MNWTKSILILVAAFVAVFLESTWDPVRKLLGAQIDLLPPLMVFAALRCGLKTICALAVWGGLCFDALSSNPLGITVLPLFIAGFVIHLRRGLIMQEQVYAQFILGLAASAFAPLVSLVMLLSSRQAPQFGWGTLWQWLVMSLGGASLTPLCFWLFEAWHRALSHRPRLETSFRPDREIKRGRN